MVKASPHDQDSKKLAIRENGHAVFSLGYLCDDQYSLVLVCLHDSKEKIYSIPYKRAGTTINVQHLPCSGASQQVIPNTS